MWRIALPVALAALAFGADNPWKKVQDLKSGSELRIYKKGSRAPLTATFDEANDERMVVVLKNEQTAIAREDIDRVDARPPAKSGRKLMATTTSKTTEPDYTPHPGGGNPVPGNSVSTSIGGVSKPDFETVYRRTAETPKN